MSPSDPRPAAPAPSRSGARFRLDAASGSLHGVEVQAVDLVEGTRDAVLLIDSDEVIRTWNQGAEAMFQYDRGEVLGRRIGFLVPPDLQEAGELEWIRHRLASEGSLSNLVTRRIRKDGTERWVSLTRSLLRDVSGKVVGSSAVFRDITEERRIRGELARAGGLAMLGEMSVTLAHEIKNRLTGIYAAVQLLGRGLRPGDDRREVIDEVAFEIKRLDATAHDLLRFARPAPLEQAPADLGEFLRGVLEPLAALPELSRHPIEREASPDLIAPIDAELLGMAIQNLVLNAAEAMEKGGAIRVLARRAPGAVEIDVCDTGPGIPDSLLGAIFRPFYTTKSQGTGLGLPIARKNVEAHGGVIEVEGTVGVGSRFRIRLPTVPVRAPSGGVR